MVESIGGWDNTVRQHLSAGTFTPFLGAGAASLRSYEGVSLEGYPWDRLAKTLGEISANVTLESRAYLKSFVQQRFRLSDPQVKKLLPETAVDDLPRKADSELNLIDLQVALVNTMRELTEIFGKAFIAQVPSLRELPDCAVTLSFARDDVQDAWRALYKAIAVARKLKKARARNAEYNGADSPWLPEDVPQESTRRFNIDRVYDKLLVLARQLIPKKNEGEVRDLFDREFSDTPDLGMVSEHLIGPNQGQLRLDMMQWLGDLLEYSLGYWIPRFPTTSELAFELGLAVPLVPPRRAELAQAAQALYASEQGTGDYIRDLMGYCEQAMRDHRFAPAHRRFYLAIAIALCDQWDHYQAALGIPRPRRSGTDAFRRTSQSSDPEESASQAGTAVGELERRAAFLPIAATTNYDCGLELVLTMHKIPYHVVFPVDSGLADGAVLQWVCRRVTHKNTPDDDQFPSNAAKLPERYPLVGPVIVKLHGAPTLDPAKDGHGGDLTHKIVLSEKEYLEALQGDAASLKWFEAEMFARLRDDASRNADELSRSIWFLGYSMADWNVRLRLYSHLRRRTSGRDDKKMRAVNRDYDPFRHAILKPLRIELCAGDLNVVPRVINEYYSDRKRLVGCSANVQKLVAALTSEYAGI